MKHKLISSATLPGKKHVPEEEFVKDKISLTFLSVLVLMAGFVSNQTVNLVGELYLTEIFLPLLAIGVIVFGKSRVFREKVFWMFVIVGICMMLGYIVSDLVAGTGSDKYFRAWGRNLILFTDFIALAVIVGSDRKLIWWFVLGIATGSITFLAINHVSIHEWKFSYSQPSILLVLLSAYFLPYRAIIISLIVLGIISIYMDSRSASAFCLFVAGVIYIRIKKPESLKLSPSALFKIMIAVLVLVTLLITVMNQTRDEFSDRRDTSSSARFAALRVGIVAIADSPILGHGSWGEGTEEYAAMIYEDLKRKMAELDRRWRKADVFRPHSQLIQVWMEGGFFAAVFFMFFGYQLIVKLKDVVLTRQLDYLTPLYANLLLVSIWHLMMSPFGGGHRLAIAISIAIICLLHIEARGKKNALNMLVHKQD